jgi:hypothetical protein
LSEENVNLYEKASQVESLTLKIQALTDQNAILLDENRKYALQEECKLKENSGPLDEKVYRHAQRIHEAFSDDCLSRLFFSYHVQKWDNLQPQQGPLVNME